MKACYNLADGTGRLEDLDKELVELAEYIKELEAKDKPSSPVKEKEGLYDASFSQAYPH
jgi:hypothetical protein